METPTRDQQKDTYDVVELVIIHILMFKMVEMKHMIRSVKCPRLTHQKERSSWGRHQPRLPRKATHSLEKTFCRNSGGGIVSPCVHTGRLMYNCSRKVCKVETYVFLLCDPKYLCVPGVRISNIYRDSL